MRSSTGTGAVYAEFFWCDIDAWWDLNFRVQGFSSRDLPTGENGAIEAVETHHKEPNP